MDTHTAVAYNVYMQYVEKTGDKTPTVIASTASPYKFNEAVLSALSPETSFDGIDVFELVDMLNVKTGLKVPASLAELKEKKVRFDYKCEKEDMSKLVSQILKIK